MSSLQAFRSVGVSLSRGIFVRTIGHLARRSAPPASRRLPATARPRTLSTAVDDSSDSQARPRQSESQSASPARLGSALAEPQAQGLITTVVGAGGMFGTAVSSRLRSHSDKDALRVFSVVRSASSDEVMRSAERWCTLSGVSHRAGPVTHDLNEAMEQSDVTILAVKPYQVEDILKGVDPELAARQVFVSALAGVPLVSKLGANGEVETLGLDRALGTTQVGRLMCGIMNDTAVMAAWHPEMSAENQGKAAWALGRIGPVIEVPDSYMPLATTGTGSYPAFVLEAFECLLDDLNFHNTTSADAAALIAQHGLSAAGALRDADPNYSACGPVAQDEFAAAARKLYGAQALEAADGDRRALAVWAVVEVLRDTLRDAFIAGGLNPRDAAVAAERTILGTCARASVVLGPASGQLSVRTETRRVTSPAGTTRHGLHAARMLGFGLHVGAVVYLAMQSNAKDYDLFAQLRAKGEFVRIALAGAIEASNIRGGGGPRKA